MARPGVTYLEVSNAAQQLVAAGKYPTIETIRIVLGTGSNSTLGAHLRNWKAAQDQTQQIATKENIPTELIASLKGVWELVMGQSEDKIQAIQSQTEHEVKELKHEIERLQHDNNHWQQQFRQLKHEKENLANENSAIEQFLANSKIELVALSEKLSGSETQNQEKQAQIDSLNKQNQQIQANLEHYRAAALEQRLSDQLRAEQQQKQLEATIKQSSAWQQKNHELNLEYNSLRLQQETTIQRLNQVSSELISKKQEQENWQTQYNDLQLKLDKQNTSMIQLQTRHALLSQQCATVSAWTVQAARIIW